MANNTPPQQVHADLLGDFLTLKKSKKMASNNIFNLEVGDKIAFTNTKKAKYEYIVKRIGEKSCFLSHVNSNYVFRQSWNSIADYQKYSDFNIIKSK